jgi:anti-sigma B factor antagonist
VEEGEEIKGLAPSLDIQQSRPNPQTCLIALRGELDVATVPEFRDTLTSSCDDESVQLVVIDLVEVTFVDSTGLMTLLNALRRLVRRGARLVLACSNPTVLRLFEATRTDATFEIVPTREQALAA